MDDVDKQLALCRQPEATLCIAGFSEELRDKVEAWLSEVRASYDPGTPSASDDADSWQKILQKTEAMLELLADPVDKPEAYLKQMLSRKKPPAPSSANLTALQKELEDNTEATDAAPVTSIIHALKSNMLVFAMVAILSNENLTEESGDAEQLRTELAQVPE